MSQLNLTLIILVLAINSCTAQFPPNKIGENLALVLALACQPSDYTISAPRFASIGTSITISVPSWVNGSFTQTGGDTVSILSSSGHSLAFQTTTVPSATLKFEFRENGVAGSCKSQSAEVTVLENTSNPTYVDASYTGGSSDGSLTHPYTDIAVAYAAAPGAVYVAGGNYPISASLTLQAGKSLYGGFTSAFKRVNDRTRTVIDDVRTSTVNLYSIGSGTMNTSTYFDGLTVQGPTDAEGQKALYCTSGSGIFNNLELYTRTTVSTIGNFYSTYLAAGCGITIQNSKLQPAAHATAYCTGLVVLSNTINLINNQIMSNDCGRPKAIDIAVNNFNLISANTIDAKGPQTSWGYAIYIGSYTNITISNQKIYGSSGGTGYSRAIFLENSGANTITDNLIYAGYGTDSQGIVLNASTGLTTIRRNTIIGGDQYGNGSTTNSIIGIYLGSVQNHIITNNSIVIYTPFTDSIGIGTDFAGVATPVIVNNTIITHSAPSGANAINLRNDVTPVIANNIIASKSSIGYHIVELHVGTDPSILENNLLFNYPQGLYYDQGVGFHNTAATINAMVDIPVNSGNMTTSPVNGIDLKTIFVDPDNLDFRLLTGSPYATAGKNVYGNAAYGNITTNRNGEARSSSGSWSVGAY